MRLPVVRSEADGPACGSAQFYMQVYQHLFGAGNALVNPEAFFWAVSILLSRATSGKQQPFTLIPFFDWFNHSDRGYAAASVASLCLCPAFTH